MRLCRVLLVDDNAAFLDATEAMLARFPQYQIVGRAHTGRDALDRVAELDPDLVLMDINMPIMDGLRAMKHLSSLPERPKVIIMTAHAEHQYQSAAKRAGADGFLVKTELVNQLLPLIRSCFPDRANDPGEDGRA